MEDLIVEKIRIAQFLTMVMLRQNRNGRRHMSGNDRASIQDLSLDIVSKKNLTYDNL